MKKRKFRKRVFLIIILVILAIGCYYVGKKIYKKLNTFNVKVVDKIDNYPYTLDDRDTELFKSNYNDLKNVLNKSEIDEETYAKLVAKLFVIDLYTMSNKVNKYDIGGLDYVLPSAKENYQLKVQDTMYKYIIDNTNKKRNQELPEVSSIEASSISDIDFVMGKENIKGYKVELTWDYIKDLGYDKKGSAIIIKDNNVLYVAEYTNE